MTYRPPLRVFALSHQVAQKFILDFLDTRSEVVNWYSVPPATVFIVSRSDLTELTALIHEGHPWLFFTLIEFTGTSINGFINQQVWDFINNPKSSGRWE